MKYDIRIAIDSITCQIAINRPHAAKKILRHNVLSAESIGKIIDQASQDTVPEIKSYRHRLVLNLGIIPEQHFAREFATRLAVAWRDFLLQEAQQSGVNNLARPEDGAQTMSYDTVTRLRQLNDDSADLFLLATDCLQKENRQQLLHSREYTLLKHLISSFLRSVGLPDLPDVNRITVGRLSLAALHYLLHHMPGKRWLQQHPPTASLLEELASVIATGEIPAVQAAKLFLAPAVSATWLPALWQYRTVRAVVQRQAGRTAAQEIGIRLHQATRQQTASHHQTEHAATQDRVVSTGQKLSNAGIVLLWPLLPQLFSALQLIEQQQFVSAEAQQQAVLCLDWLAWGDPAPAAERLVLGQLLCGLPPATIPIIESLNPSQKALIDRWFNAIRQQLTAWQKLNLADIRQLWLQRPGQLLNDRGQQHILVQPESFDLLLGTWPWPLTLLTFPWLDRPVALEWSRAD